MSDAENYCPLWMGDLANRILESWPAWEAEAEQQAQIEQDSDAAQYVMLGRIEAAIKDAFIKR